MPTISINKKTWKKMKEEEEAMQLDFAKSVFEDYYTHGKSLRTIAEERQTSHETVRRLIQLAENAREPQSRRATGEKVTAT